MRPPIVLKLDADTPQFQGLCATPKGPGYRFFFRFRTYSVSTAGDVKPLDEHVRVLVHLSLGAHSTLSCAIGAPRLPDSDALRLAPHVFDALRTMLITRGTRDGIDGDDCEQIDVFMSEREFPADYRPRSRRDIAMREPFLLGEAPAAARMGFHAQ
jgi:hypothetical protein